jgi:hypothetical protein
VQYGRQPYYGPAERSAASIDTFEVISPCAVQSLPQPVAQTLAGLLREKRLVMAAPAEDWNSGCVLAKGFLDGSCLFAGHAGDSWLVHFQQGGIGVMTRTVVIAVEGKSARVAWSGSCNQKVARSSSPDETPADKVLECSVAD